MRRLRGGARLSSPVGRRSKCARLGYQSKQLSGSDNTAGKLGDQFSNQKNGVALDFRTPERLYREGGANARPEDHLLQKKEKTCRNIWLLVTSPTTSTLPKWTKRRAARSTRSTKRWGTPAACNSLAA